MKAIRGEFMPRIDFRINRSINGEIVTAGMNSGEESPCPVTVTNISLGGALVEGKTDGLDNKTCLRLLIGDRHDLELPARSSARKTTGLIWVFTTTMKRP